MIKRWIKKWLGMETNLPYKVTWRQKETIDGVFWERIHYPYVDNSPQWNQNNTKSVYFLYRGV